MKSFLFILFLWPVITFAQEFIKYEQISDSLIQPIVIGNRTFYSYKDYSFEYSSTSFKIRQNKKLILTDESFEGQKKIIPHIFQLPDTSKSAILMVDHYFKQIFGFSLYELTPEGPYKIGFLPVAMASNDKEKTSESIAAESISDSLLLESDGITLRFSFLVDQIVLFPGTVDEEILPGNKSKFLYNGKRLKEVEEF